LGGSRAGCLLPTLSNPSMNVPSDGKIQILREV
jgi:hypothetical protein